MLQVLISNKYPAIDLMKIFRTSDAEMIANFRVQAELSAVESTEDGKCIVLGTVDGCLSVFAIADPQKPEMKEYLLSLPSRDEQVLEVLRLLTGVHSTIKCFYFSFSVEKEGQ